MSFAGIGYCGSAGPVSHTIGTPCCRNVFATAEKLLKGELKEEPPPFELPAKMYVAEGAAFFYD